MESYFVYCSIFWIRILNTGVLSHCSIYEGTRRSFLALLRDRDNERTFTAIVEAIISELRIQLYVSSMYWSERVS